MWSNGIHIEKLPCGGNINAYARVSHYNEMLRHNLLRTNNQSVQLQFVSLYFFVTLFNWAHTKSVCVFMWMSPKSRSQNVELRMRFIQNQISQSLFNYLIINLWLWFWNATRKWYIYFRKHFTHFKLQYRWKNAAT